MELLKPSIVLPELNRTFLSGQSANTNALPPHTFGVIAENVRTALPYTNRSFVDPLASENYIRKTELMTHTSDQAGSETFSLVAGIIFIALLAIWTGFRLFKAKDRLWASFKVLIFGVPPPAHNQSRSTDRYRRNDESYYMASDESISASAVNIDVPQRTNQCEHIQDSQLRQDTD